MLASNMGGVGPAFDPEKLGRIIRSLEKRGVTFVTGEDGHRICQAQQARALYWPARGGPGTLIFADTPTRREVVEEWLHLAQYRARGWPSSADDPRLRFEVEVEAQERLLALAARKGWSAEEIADLRRAKGIWLNSLRHLEARP